MIGASKRQNMSKKRSPRQSLSKKKKCPANLKSRQNMSKKGRETRTNFLNNDVIRKEKERNQQGAKT